MQVVTRNLLCLCVVLILNSVKPVFVNGVVFKIPMSVCTIIFESVTSLIARYLACVKENVPRSNVSLESL